LRQYLDKVKSPGKGGLYGELYGDSLAGLVGGSWADPTRKPREVKNPDDTSPGSKEGEGNETWVIDLTVDAAQQSKTSFRKNRAGLEAAEGNDLFSDSVDERGVPVKS